MRCIVETLVCDICFCSKSGDSTRWTAMSRRNKAQCRTNISIMRCATLSTSPFSHSQACSPFRTAVTYTATARTGLERVRFVDHYKHTPRHYRFNAKLRFWPSPTYIQHGLRHLGFYEFLTADVTHYNETIFFDNFICKCTVLSCPIC